VGQINMTICSWVPLAVCHGGRPSRIRAGGLITQFGSD